ncbi:MULTISPECIES: class I SAM-dependent methyltransferase [Prauserella salsuginis group]|uniref:SAM-dependent methyltransferase n=2 Tax=Prauserella salsuginis group TaxID=2893672 RepID=A0A839XNQ1_9PSEU|nr:MULTISPECIES: class I SAM-dependent methyltransferase [Prauserella salsuginis group]MBB3661586.1 SAM-dependent methyltransferase [Prauserella sediminis]MCR3719502.1 Methyltransferase domain-containing protein [Prauserella flava]MCR3735484.1 Methyltransferase domain-containing protein [Prauserella salsuginis]
MTLQAAEQDGSAQEGHGAFAAATGRSLEGDNAKPNYLEYQRELIRPYAGRSVLEIGAGDGEFVSGYHDAERYVVTDVDPEAVQQMKSRFADRNDVEVQQFDGDGNGRLTDPVETLLAINVLEHIEDDAGALRSLSKSVTPGGKVIMFVPGYQQLYGEFDRLVGHYRRYTPRTLTAAARRAGLSPEVAKPVNFLGAFAWWAAVRKGGTGSPNPKLVSMYDRYVVPVTKTIEKNVRVPFGQSILLVARTPVA